MRFRLPVGLNVAILIVATTAFYTYVGQLVPQSEIQPPEEVLISKEMTTDDLVAIGDRIAHGKGLCLTCHTIGESGALRFPDLSGIGARAGRRIEGMDDVEYLAHSLYEPDAYIVEGFNPGMPVIDKPPIGLTDEEILAVIAWLQSMGGTPSVTLQTSHDFYTPQ
jgi:mono/diheme cytochrome c family protein